jgi:hypothetical protein
VRSRQYGHDVLAAGQRRPRPGQGPVPQVEAETGLVVEDSDGRFCGAVTGFEKDAVTLEDRHGKRRVFPLPGTFLLEGQRVTLIRPKVTSGDKSRFGGHGSGGRGSGGRGFEGSGSGGSGSGGRTASGSIAPPVQRAKVAQASRIYVEGKHDAELVEKIWGDDLRDVGIVVEYLEGIDDLPAIAKAFGPGPGRRLGVLVDHLIDGSKESRIAAAARSPDVLVAGHPFIDIWAAVKPAAVGLSAWPDVPPGQPWKEGVLRAIGWPAATPADIAAAWRRILRCVTTYADLEPELLGRVEELIDFVTAPAGGYP